MVCSAPLWSQISWFSNFSVWLFGFCVLSTICSLSWSQQPGDFLWCWHSSWCLLPGLVCGYNGQIVLEAAAWPCVSVGSIGTPLFLHHSFSAMISFLNRNILMVQYMFLLSEVAILNIIVIWWSCRTIEKVKIKTLFTVLLFCFFLALQLILPLHPTPVSVAF